MEQTIIQLLIAILIGASIGLERESSGQGSHAVAGGGLRTYSLVALLGGLAGLFYTANFSWAFTVISLAFFGLLTSFYILSTKHTQDYGLTSEIAFVLTYTLGVCLTTQIIPTQIIIALSVVFMLILALKDKTKLLISEVTRREVESFISFAIIALVILPFLPNRSISLQNFPTISAFLTDLQINLSPLINIELLNPRKIWLIVVLVTGIELLGYALSKFVGTKKGFALTSFVGGFISSTSVTQSLAVRSKNLVHGNYLIAGAILANIASFLQIFLLIGPLNTSWLIYIFPTLIIMIVVAGATAGYYYKSSKNMEQKEDLEETNKQIFSLIPALKFAMLILGVKLLTNIALVYFGESGFLLSSILAGFVGLDAVLVNLASMAGGQISYNFALITLILVNASNLLSKTGYAFLMGSKHFAFKFFGFACVVILSSLFGLLIK